jgi:hypothetical protein
VSDFSYRLSLSYLFFIKSAFSSFYRSFLIFLSSFLFNFLFLSLHFSNFSSPPLFHSYFLFSFSPSLFSPPSLTSLLLLFSAPCNSSDKLFLNYKQTEEIEDLRKKVSRTYTHCTYTLYLHTERTHLICVYIKNPRCDTIVYVYFHIFFAFSSSICCI